MPNLIKTWDSSSLSEMLSLLVGRHYGDNPLNQLDKIIEVKFHESQNIIRYLNLTSNDVVMDLGSGCGFIAENIAKNVNSVACVDISETFLKYAQKVNAHHSNISYHHIPYGNLEINKRFTAIYSVAVFIHFNLYDCYWYLKQCYDSLETNGKFFFDILNSQKLDINNELWLRHSQRYLRDQKNLFTSVYYNDKETIKNIAEQIGFNIENCFDENDHSFFTLRKK